MRLSQVVLAFLTAVALAQDNYGLVGVWTGLFLMTVVSEHQAAKKK